MEASGAIIPSIVCSGMTRSSRWIFLTVFPAYRPGFYQWYISIQLRDLGTIYWAQWCSHGQGLNCEK